MSRDCRTHRQAVEELAWGLLDGPRHAGERARLEGHLRDCDACRKVLAAERAITESLTAVGRVDVAVSVEARVMAALPAEAPRPSGRLRRWQAGILVLVAGGGALVEATASGGVALALLKASVILSRFLPTEITDLGRSLVDLLPVAVQTAATLARAADAVLRGLSQLLPPAPLAVSFVALLLVITFVTVRRDRRAVAITLSRGNR